MKNIHTVEVLGDWTGYGATLRSDDSLRVVFSSAIEGTRDNGIYLWKNTGLISAMADDETDPEEMIMSWLENHDIDQAKCLQRGHIVE